MEEGGLRVDTPASPSTVAASSLVQLDGDVLTAIDPRYYSDEHLASRHLESVSAVLEELWAWMASLTRIIRAGVIGLGLLSLLFTLVPLGISAFETREYLVRGAVGLVVALVQSFIVPSIARQYLRRWLGLGA